MLGRMPVSRLSKDNQKAMLDAVNRWELLMGPSESLKYRMETVKAYLKHPDTEICGLTFQCGPRKMYLRALIGGVYAFMEYNGNSAGGTFTNLFSNTDLYLHNEEMKDIKEDELSRKLFDIFD